VPNTIIADSGFWIALFDRSDRYHARSALMYRDNIDALYTTWPVLTETCHYLGARLHSKAPQDFLAAIIDGVARVMSQDNSDLQRMHTLMGKYEDLPMDLADASLVVLAERLGHGRILSTDLRDFNTYKWKNRKPFQNLLLPEFV
jgi:uncharacterized protein